ncbi:MAG: prephenate dehydratase [Rikenellaceae bacterium]
MKISIQGYEGSFHQIAAEKYFGGEIEIVPCATFREVTLAVENGSVNAGIMAIENSIAGSILPNYALLQNPSLTVTGEVYLSIEQNLLGVKGASIADIKEVESHPMALLQCLNFLEDNIKGVRMVESADTALSAKDVALRGDKSVAAIASRRAAELFGLEILAPNINTVKVNYTRFLVIEQSDKVILHTNANKASLYFKVSHERGTLLEALSVFEDKNINMSKLQSYPIPTDPFRYLFHVDVEFEGLERFRECVDELRSHTEDFCICGIYVSNILK